eukprot:1384669-Amorphochlora_amoeboformis.AAC.2
MRKHEMSGSDSSLSSLGNSLSSMFSFKRGVKARNMAGKRMGKRERHGESESSKVTLETVLSDQPKARFVGWVEGVSGCSGFGSYCDVRVPPKERMRSRKPGLLSSSTK